MSEMLAQNAALDVQLGFNTGFEWVPASSVDGGFTHSRRSVERSEFHDPAKLGHFVPGPMIRKGTDFHTFSVTVCRKHGEKVLDTECLINFRVRHGCSGATYDTDNWEEMDYYVGAMVTGDSSNIGPIMKGDDNDLIYDTFEVSAMEFYKGILPLYGTVVDENITSANIVAIANCSIENCGDCGDQPDDGSSVWKMVTAPQGDYDYPLLVVYDFRKEVGSRHETYNIPFMAGTTPTAILCYGSRTLVVGDEKAGYTTDGTVWTQITGIETGHGILDVYSDGMNIFASGKGGYIYQLDGSEFKTVYVGSGSTAVDFNRIAVRGNLVVAVGDNGIVVRSLNLGKVFKVLSGPTGISDDYTALLLPRDGYIVVGTDAGQVYRYNNLSWKEVSINTGNTGTINDLVDIGILNGEIILALHTDSTPESGVFVSYDGAGDSFEEVEIPSGLSLVRGAGANPNFALAVGNSGKVVVLEGQA